MKDYLKKNGINSIIPGMIIGLLFTVGFFVNKDGAFSISAFGIGVYVVSSVLFCCALTGLYRVSDIINDKNMQRVTEYLPNRIVKKSWFYGLICFVILLVMLAPTFLAFYPGIFAYDAPWQYTMIAENRVTAHHPVLHTYMLGGIIDFVFKATGSINKAAAAYTVTQMLIMTFGEAYILYIFHREKVNTAFHIVALLFFGLFPTCSIFVMTMTKDSIFSVAVADLCVLSYLLMKDVKGFFEKKSNVIFWILFLLEVLIFRNNAKYALICVLPFFIVALCKSNKRVSEKDEFKKLTVKGIALLFIAISLYTVYDIPITKMLTVDGISKAEMLSVPFQQLARVYNYRNEELSDEQKDTIEQVFGNDELLLSYVPQQADNIKKIADMELIESDKMRYFNFWLQTGFEFPKEYIDSFLENTCAFWYPFPQYVAYTNGGILYTNTLSVVPVEQNPKIGWLYEFYDMFSDGIIVDGLDIISWIFSPAFYLYIFIASCGYAVGHKKRYTYIPHLFVVLLWMTYLLGPVALVRYSLYLFYMMPCLFMVFINFGTKKSQMGNGVDNGDEKK